MYCSSCKKQIPENSTFCGYCGEPISASESTPAVPEWEYDSFIYRFPPHYMRIRRERYSETEVKRKFWQKAKDEIWIELQKWLDKGWEPVGIVMASCIEIRTDNAIAVNVITGLFLGIMVLVGGGGYAGSEGLTYAEPVAFQLEMRRLKINPIIPSMFNRLLADLEEAEHEKRELESSFAYRLGRFIRKLFSRPQ